MIKMKKEKKDCKTHEHENKVGYVEWHQISDRLLAKGVKQEICPECGLWLWPIEEWNKDGCS